MKLLSKVSDGTAWPRLSREAGWRFLVVWVSLLGLLYSTLSVVRHNHYQSGAFDLGIYDQAVWQYSKLAYPYNTVKERFILGDHLTLTLPLLAPLFWVWDDVRILLIAQAFFVTTSVLAVYKLILFRAFTPLVALLMSVIYSLFYGIQYGIFFDFHPVLLGVALIPWLLYFLESGRKKLVILFLFLLLLTQENMGLALASIGCVYLFRKKYRITAIGFIFGGILWSLIAIRLISALSPIGFEYTPEIPLNPMTFLTRLFDDPEKLQTWGYTLSSYAFLPLLSPGALMGIALDLSQYFVTGDRFFPMWTPFKHHRAILAPIVLLGALETLALFRKKKYPVTFIVIGLLIVALGEQYIFHHPLNKLTKYDYWNTQRWMSDNDHMIASIPKDAGVATQQSMVPHLTHRKKIYLVWPRLHDMTEKPCGRVSCWWLDFSGNPEYLLIDTHPTVWLTMLLETPEHVSEALANMEKLRKITLTKKVGDVRLYTVR